LAAQERRLVPSRDLDSEEVSLSSQSFIEPITSRLNPTGSFYDVALHFGRQVGKFSRVPRLLAVFAEGLLEKVIVGVDIIGGHDVFSCM
jgi:hypothetical protein